MPLPGRAGEVAAVSCVDGGVFIDSVFHQTEIVLRAVFAFANLSMRLVEGNVAIL